MPLLKQAKIVLGATSFKIHITTNTLEVELQSGQLIIPKDDLNFSLPMYYGFYYRMLFMQYRRRDKASLGFGWQPLHASNLAPESENDCTSEAHALLEMARNGDELVWTLAVLVASLNAYLPPESVASVLSTAFSIRYDPWCISPVERSKLELGTITNYLPDIPASVGLYFAGKTPTKTLKFRYGTDSTIGKRLLEDIYLLSKLADRSNLQNDICEQIAFESSRMPKRQPPTGSYFSLDRTDVTAMAMEGQISKPDKTSPTPCMLSI